MEARRTLPQGRRHVVSIISGEPNFPQQQALVQGFSTGVRRALPGVEIRSDYSFEYDDQATCERIANRQIDAGSGVVFATAGDCASGRAHGRRHSRRVGRRGRRRSLAPRPAHSRVCVPALRPPRRVDCELVPGRTAAAGWGRRARTRRRRRRARRYQPRRAPGDPGQGCSKKLRGFERRKCGRARVTANRALGGTPLRATLVGTRGLTTIVLGEHSRTLAQVRVASHSGLRRRRLSIPRCAAVSSGISRGSATGGRRGWVRSAAASRRRRGSHRQRSADLKRLTIRSSSVAQTSDRLLRDTKAPGFSCRSGASAT